MSDMNASLDRYIDRMKPLIDTGMDEDACSHSNLAASAAMSDRYLSQQLD